MGMLNNTADTGAAGILAAGGAALSGNPDFIDEYQKRYLADLETIKATQQQNKTLGTIINENIGSPLADLTNQVFDIAQGDSSKIPYAETQSNAAQFLGNLIVPVGAAGAAQATGHLAGSLLEQVGKGAKIGAGFGAITGVGNTPNLKEYAKHVGVSTALGAAIPPAAMGINKGFQAAKGAAKQVSNFAKGTSSRIQAELQQMTQDRIGHSMNEIKAAQDKIIQRQRQPQQVKPVEPTVQTEVTGRVVQGKQVPSQAMNEWIAGMEEHLGQKLTPEQKQQLAVDLEKNLINQNREQRRREFAAQRLRELRSQSEIENMQLKQAAAQQQVERIQQFLKDKPKKLLPSEKQKAIRNKILRAQQFQRKLQEANPPEPVRERPSEAAQAETQQAVQHFATEIQQRQADIQKLVAEREKIKPKITKTNDGSLENAIAERLKEVKISKESWDKVFGKTDNPNIKRTYLRAKKTNLSDKNKQAGTDLDLIAQSLEDNFPGTEPDVIIQKIGDFVNENPTTPNKYYEARAVKEAEQAKGQIDQAIKQSQSEIHQMRSALEEVTPNQVEVPRSQQIISGFLEKQQKNLDRAKNIQRTKINQAARKELGVEDVRTDSLRNEVTRLEAEANDLQTQINQANNALIKEARDFGAEKSNSEDFLKDQGLSYAGYEDGKLKAVSFEAQDTPTKVLNKKFGDAKFTIKVSKDGKPIEISRDPSPVEKAVKDATDGPYNQIDRLFGLTEEPVVVTKDSQKIESVNADLLGHKTPSSKLFRGVKEAIRRWFQPIQNGVDELSQNIGNRLANMEATRLNLPIKLASELADAVGFKYKGEFDIRKFYEHIKKIFPEKTAYVNAAQRPERLTAEQSDFLIKSQDFWKGQRDYLEAGGIDPAELISGLYAPREYIYNEWFKLQDANTQHEIKSTIEKLSAEYHDDDFVMNEFTEKRKFDEVPEDYLNAHHDPADAILLRIKKIAKQKSLQEFFGNKLKKGQGHKELIQQMIKDEKLDGTPDGRELEYLLGRLFDKTPYSDNPLVNFANRLRFWTTLGSVETAAKQPLLGAVRYSARFNLDNMGKGLQMMNDPRMQNYMAGLLGDIEKGDIGTKMKLMDEAATGLFKLANRKEASMGMGAAYHAMVAHSDKIVNGRGNKPFMDYMKRRYGSEEGSKLVQKFAAMKNRKYTGLDLDIMNAVTTYARDRGSLALTKADKTPKALDKGTVVSEAYKLMTYGLKDTNTMVDLTAGEMQRGNTFEGLKNIVTQIAIPLAIQGLVADQILRVGAGAQTAMATQDFGEGYKRGGLARTGHYIEEAFLSIIPFLSRYSLDKLMDPNSVNEVIANTIFKGSGTTTKLIADSIKGTVEGVKSSNAKGAAPDLFGAFNPDLNKSFKNLPPKPIAETYYNLIDPALRGNAASVVLKEQEKLQFEASKTAEGKLQAQIKLENKYKNAGIPVKLAGTAEGASLYEKATNKKYKEHLHASETFSPLEKRRGRELLTEIGSMAPEDMRSYIQSLSSQDEKALLAGVQSQATSAYSRGKISAAMYKRVVDFTREKGFPSTIEKVKREVKKVVKLGSR